MILSDNNKLKLIGVKISGFRGYNQPKEIKFNGKTTVLFGDTGSGKSSTLGALEWCFFGSFASLRYLLQKEQKEALTNDFSREIVVTVELTNNDETFLITRQKKKGSTNSRLEIKLSSGEVVTGKEAERKLYQIIRLQVDDFTRAVYIHQEDMRSLFVDNKDIRNEALDRLFGLDQLRNISDGLTQSTVRKAMGDIGNERNVIISIITSQLKEAQIELEKSRQKAKETGIEKDNFDLEGALQLYKQAFARIERLAKPLGIDLPETEIKNNADVETAAKIIRSCIKKIRGKLPQRTEIDQLSKERNEFQGINSSFAEASAKFDLVHVNLNVFHKKYGNKSELNKKVIEYTKKISDLQEQSRSLDAEQTIVSEALEFFRKFDTIKHCPICKKIINRSEVLRHLETEAKKKLGRDIEAIGLQIDKYKNEKEESKSRIEELDELEKKEKRTNEELESIIVSAAKELGQKLAKDDFLAILEKKITGLDSQIKRLEEPLAKQEEELSEFEEYASKIESIGEILHRLERCNQLAELQKTEEIKEAENVVTQLQKLFRSIEIVSEAIRAVQSEIAEKLISVSLPTIREYYTVIVNHPHWKELDIEVEPETIRGILRTNYKIKGITPKEKMETPVGQRFSTGQMNAVALSIFLGLANCDAYKHNINFLVLDDPSQNLDIEKKKSLAKILAEVSRKKQVIVASQDKEFQEILESELKSSDINLIRFGKWAIDTGPHIVVK